MDKELFVRAINEIKEHRRRDDVFAEAVSEISPSSYPDTFLFSDYEGLVIDLLCEAMNDNEEIIPWWIYDTKFGEEELMRSLFIEDTEVELKTPEQLYDYLIKK